MNKSTKNPPGLLFWMIEQLIPEQLTETGSGDYAELYQIIYAERGKWRAKVWLLLQVFRAVPYYISESILWSTILFRNYVLTAWRNIVRNKIYSFINISGLAIGLTASILILLFVNNELSFNNFHKDEERLFRVGVNFPKWDGPDEYGKSCPVVMGPALREYFPEVESSIRFASQYAVVRHGEKRFSERIRFTDKEFFDVFSFDLAAGDPATALSDLSSIVLTEQYAEKYFGDENPTGKTLSLTFGDKQRDFTVSGIARNMPNNSSILFNFLVRVENMEFTYSKEAVTNWGDFSYPIYLKLNENSRPESMNKKFPEFVTTYIVPAFSKWDESASVENPPVKLQLQKIRDIHSIDNAMRGSSRTTFLLMSIAFFILAIASINFMNLSIARSSQRFTEFGMRRVLGANRKQLMRQFWSESTVMTGISMFTGIILAILLLPLFNELAGKRLTTADLLTPLFIAEGILTIFIVGILSGSYPAIVMTAFKPVEVLKNRIAGRGKTKLNKTLVALQFALSIFMLLVAIFVGRQLYFMIGTDTGYNKDGLVTINIQEYETEAEAKVLERFKTLAASYPDIENVSAASVTFGAGRSGYPIQTEEGSLTVIQYKVAHDYLKTIGVELITGRDFSREIASDSNAVIVNESLLNIMKIENPLGKQLGNPSDGYPYHLTIIGVVPDYHFLSLKREIGPMIIHMVPGWGLNRLLVSINTGNISETLINLESIWKEIQPDKPFTYSFISDDLARQYSVERRWFNIVQYSTIFAFLIALMGMYGLISFAVTRRIKEIGIRKVLGARVLNIYNLIVKEYVVLVLAANLISWPAAYFTVRQILQNYHYRIDIEPLYFIITGAVSILVMLLVISYSVVKTANRNPADSLRTE